MDKQYFAMMVICILLVEPMDIFTTVTFIGIYKYMYLL